MHLCGDRVPQPRGDAVLLAENVPEQWSTSVAQSCRFKFLLVLDPDQ